MSTAADFSQFQVQAERNREATRQALAAANAPLSDPRWLALGLGYAVLQWLQAAPPALTEEEE